MQVQAANSVLANEVSPLELIIMHASLPNQRMLLVQRYLSGLVAIASDHLNQVALAVGAFTTEAQESRRIIHDDQIANKQQKGPSETWKSMLPTLLKLCKVGYKSLLPQFYTTIFKVSNRKELPESQGDLNRLASSNITHNMEPPVLSAKMLRRLVDLDWESHYDAYLEGGLAPWCTIYFINTEKEDLQRHASRYNLQVGGDTVSYTNVDKFYEIDAHVSLPIKLSQVKRSLESHVIVCSSGLWVAHWWNIISHSSIQASQRYEFESDEKFEILLEWCANVICWFSLRHISFPRPIHWPWIPSVSSFCTSPRYGTIYYYTTGSSIHYPGDIIN